MNGESPCLVVVSKDASGSSSTGNSPPIEFAASSVELLLELRQLNQFLRELLAQNAMLINLVIEDRQEEEHAEGTYLDGSRVS